MGCSFFAVPRLVAAETVLLYFFFLAGWLDLVSPLDHKGLREAESARAREGEKDSDKERGRERERGALRSYIGGMKLQFLGTILHLILSLPFPFLFPSPSLYFRPLSWFLRFRKEMAHNFAPFFHPVRKNSHTHTHTHTHTGQRQSALVCLCSRTEDRCRSTDRRLFDGGFFCC